MLQPDKHKSIGADGAFKFISEAWNLLSDKAKRLAYDQKWNVKVPQNKVPPPSGGPLVPPGANGFYNFPKSTTSHTKVQSDYTSKVGAYSAHASSHKQKPGTFWTACHGCPSDSNPDKKLIERMSINVPYPDFHDFDRDQTERCFGENQVWAAYDDDDVMFITWTKGASGAIQIFPRKGDVWALYRNWSPEWNELTADEVIHEYEELGQEALNSPKGCDELDPAATPLELLQVIIDVKEEEIVENEERKKDG
ncbi:hypothetical protein F0562_033143 [Nyssa sinensis]|uniref:J domain-containing protein n=1 Tax=Nyssa sinensis TaxID=561372 RepID=A0A5J5ASR8_9ASTE|nr:hypothetical protein F0562_033143 [Nyssa sinensis]